MGDKKQRKRFVFVNCKMASVCLQLSLAVAGRVVRARRPGAARLQQVLRQGGDGGARARAETDRLHERARRLPRAAVHPRAYLRNRHRTQEIQPLLLTLLFFETA